MQKPSDVSMVSLQVETGGPGFSSKVVANVYTTRRHHELQYIYIYIICGLYMIVAVLDIWRNIFFKVIGMWVALSNKIEHVNPTSGQTSHLPRVVFSTSILV